MNKRVLMPPLLGMDPSKAIRRLLCLMIAVCATLTTTISFAQTGTAPVSPPTGGFGIEGDLTATGAAGDWLKGAQAQPYGVLFDSGLPVDPSHTFHITDVYNTGNDNIFGGGDKWNDDPNTWGWTLNSSNGKTDINNALVHFTTDPVTNTSG